MDIYLELVGYTGTALVIVSMMMTSVVRLRLFNIAGALISVVYAALSGTWPIVVLNAVLSVINTVQLVRARSVGRSYSFVSLGESDAVLEHFLACYRSDILAHFPDFSTELPQDSEIYAVFSGAEMSGISVGRRDGESMELVLDYTTPRYRDTSVGEFLYGRLADTGVTELRASASCEKHRKYLTRVGFNEENGILIKRLGTNDTKGG